MTTYLPIVARGGRITAGYDGQTLTLDHRLRRDGELDRIPIGRIASVKHIGGNLFTTGTLTVTDVDGRRHVVKYNRHERPAFDALAAALRSTG